MIIIAPGKYLTRDGKTADIFRVDQTTAVGRVPEYDTEAHIWDVHTGDAIGHSLLNSLVSKQHNLPEMAQQIVKTLGTLDLPTQRLQVLNIVDQQICPVCGADIEPGLKCSCKAQKTAVQHGKSGRKRVH